MDQCKEEQYKNKQFLPYMTMAKLDQHKPYQVIDIILQDHVLYGQTLIFVLKDPKMTFKSCCPKKYQSVLSQADVVTLKEHISQQKNPFLVVTHGQPNNSLILELAPHSAQLLIAHNNWAEVGPEILENVDVPEPTIEKEQVETTDKTEIVAGDYLARVFKIMCTTDEPLPREESLEQIIASNNELLKMNEQFNYEEEEDLDDM